jgi:hypothetical protein
MKINYRKLWSEHFGDIPKDEFGRSFEIHHKDGNHKNNALENLECVSIQDHYNRHYQNADYGACVMIAKRMNMPPDHISKIQLGKKRPGVGGVKKGTKPWNKGINGYKLNLTESGKQKRIYATKKNNKITDECAIKIRKDYDDKVYIDNDKIGKTQQNGRVFSYGRAFCLEYSMKYKVSDQYIYRIIKNKVKNV